MTFEEKLLAAKEQGATRDDVLGTIPSTSTAEHRAAVDRVFPVETPVPAQAPRNTFAARLGFEPIERPRAQPETFNPELAPTPEPVPEQSLGDLWAKSRELDSTLGAASRYLDERAFPVDPGYRLDNYDELAKEIPEAYQGMFQEQMLEAKSAEHAIAIQSRFKEELQLSQEVSQAGWAGLGTRFAANLLDEGGLVLAVAGPAGWLAKGGRVARFVKMGAAAGVENALLEQVVKTGSKTRTSEDVMYALLGGLALGGAIGAALPGRKAATPGAADAPPVRQPQTQPQATPETAAGAGEIHGPQPLHGPDVPRKAAEAIHELDKASVRAVQDNSPQPLTGRAKAHADANTEAVLDEVGYVPRPERAPDELAAARAAKKEARKAAAAAKRAEAQVVAKRAKQEARVAELEVEMKTLRTTEVDAPVKPVVREELAKVKQALADVKAAAKATDAKVRIRADQAMQQAKRHFMRILQEKHTDEFNKSGLSANPKTADFEAWVKGKGARVVTKIEKAFTKETEAYNKTLDTLDEQLVRLKDEHTALKGELAAPPAKPVEPAAPEAQLDSAGAARAGVSEPDLATIDDDILMKMESEVTDTAMANARGGLFATLNKSENSVVRWLGGVLMSDHVGAKDKNWVGRKSATTRSQLHEEATIAKYTAATRAAYLGWAKAQGLHLWTAKGIMQRGIGLKHQFNKLVFEAVESGSTDPHVTRAAQAWSELSKKTIDYAKAAGVEGWDKIPHRADYVPHVHNTAKWRRLSTDLEGQTAPLQELVYGSMRAANPDLDEAIARSAAKKYVDSIRRREAGINGAYFDMTRMVDPAYARNLFEEIDLEPQEVDYLLKMLSGADKAKDAGGLSRAKHRTLLDMDYEVKVRDKETGEEYALKMRDMFEQDIDKLAHSYVRSIGGWAGIADATKGSAYHITSPAKFNYLLAEAARLEADSGARTNKGQALVTRVLSGKLGDDAGATLNSEVALLEMLRNNLTGVPINDPTNAMTKWARRIKDYNFVTMMGQVIWAQASELGSVISHLGWIRTMQAVPEALQAIKRSKVTGELDHELARLAETEVGMGSTALRGREHPMWVSDTDAMSESYSMLDAGLHHAKNIVAAPMHAAMTFQQRIMAIGMLNKFGDFAMGRIKFSEGEMSRMRHLGLSEADLDSIKAEYAQHATWSNMQSHSGKLLNPNPEKWGNYDSWLKLKDALSLISKRVVQENDMSNVPPILSKNFASMAVQFRSFIIGAHEKHLLNGLHHRDMEAFTNMVYTSMFAGLAYVGMTHTKAIGMDDKRKRKYLKERLSTQAIATAAYSRASWSALTPTAVDTVLARGGFDPVFAHTRGSGLNTSFVSGIPAVASADKLLRAGVGVVAPIVNPNYQLSDADWNAMSGALPTGNLIGVYNVLNAMGNSLDLPRSSKDR